MSKRDFNSRLYAVFLFFVLANACLLTRLAYVQVIKSSKFKAYARQQHSIYTEIAPLRGAIFDRNFKELAVNRSCYSVFATNEFWSSKNAQERPVLKNTERLSTLTSLLDLKEDNLYAKLSSLKNFVWLKRKVGPEISAKIKELNIPGIEQVREDKRFYPNGPFASHVLGFTDVDNRGLEGVELFCNPYLAGVKGWRQAHRDAKRREVICWGYKSILASDGYNVVLTIDSVIQSIVERQMRQAVRKYKATSASAIVVEPKSGEILAFYNYPDYDLNNFGDCQADVRRNLAITDIFEPGSSFKFVTAAAALEENLVTLEDKFFCEWGKYRIGGRILHDYKPYGELSFEQVVERSSNIGMAKVAQLLGKDTLYAYIKRFGFGECTGIDLPGEVAGIVRTPDQWSGTSISSIPMGQEVAVTPMQLIFAISSVANDGVLVKPKILKLVQRKDGQIIKSYPSQEVRRVISIETAQTLKEILVGAVERGTGKMAKVSGYKTAGKTGTAQKTRPEGGYYKRKFVSSFIGFVPADQPLISILVVLSEPYPRYFGGTVCAPVFKEIATETLRYLEASNEALTYGRQ